MALPSYLNPSGGGNYTNYDTFFGADYGNSARQSLGQNAYDQSQFGSQLGGNYLGNQAGINNTIGGLQAIANGQNSVSAEQLRQGLQQAQRQQMSAAASANPAAGPAAARTAMMQMGQQASGMMGQQAAAGLQERQNALGTLSQLQLGQAGQNLQGYLGSYAGANQAFNSYLQNKPVTFGQYYLGAIGGAAGGAGRALGSGVGGG